jgi:hypothetical protein
MMKFGLVNLFVTLAALVSLGVSALTVCVPASQGKIEGVVLDEARRPVKDVRIVIDQTTATGGIQEILPVTNGEGRFDWTDLPPGAYTLRALKEGYKPQTRTAEVKGGETAQVEFVLQADVN